MSPCVLCGSREAEVPCADCGKEHVCGECEDKPIPESVCDAQREVDVLVLPCDGAPRIVKSKTTYAAMRKLVVNGTPADQLELGIKTVQAKTESGSFSAMLIFDGEALSRRPKPKVNPHAKDFFRLPSFGEMFICSPGDKLTVTGEDRLVGNLAVVLTKRSRGTTTAQNLSVAAFDSVVKPALRERFYQSFNVGDEFVVGGRRR